jgi:hypothetical protein
MKRTIPQIGLWYKEIQQGTMFEVVAVDELEQTIEIQLLDGAIEEYDFDNWKELLLEGIEEPEDWRNAYELSSEDCLDPDAAIYPEDWNSPLSMIETDIVNGVLDDL